MSSNNSTITLASDDWQLSQDDQARPIALVVHLRRRAWVLPYFRFVCSDGDNEQVRITFASHLVTVTGHGLYALLSAVATQRVTQLTQPSTNDAKFGVRGSNGDLATGPTITDITVAEFK